MINTIINFLQEIGDRMAGLWESGKQLFEIVDTILAFLRTTFSTAFSSGSQTGNALIPQPLIFVCTASLIIFCIKIIIGSSNG